MSRRKKLPVKYEGFNAIGFDTNRRLIPDETPVTDDTLVVLVTHSFYSSLPYIVACETLAGRDNLLLVLKNSSKNPGFREELEQQGYHISDNDKKVYKTKPQEIIRELKERMEESGLEKVFIMDHGGYFSYHLREFANNLPISGIAEYTINGGNKFREVFNLAPSLAQHIPYASIERSPLKIFPDISCGRLIGELIGQVTQEFTGFSPHIRDFTQVGIIGFGTLGENAALMLKASGAHNIMVHDIDELKRTRAAIMGYNVVDSAEDIISSCNVIVVGTDKAPITKEMFRMMRDGTIISGVTSADDTWELDKRTKDQSVSWGRKTLGGKIRTLKMMGDDGREKKIYAIYDGESPNLVGSEIGVSDPSLFLPTSHHVMVARELLATGRTIPEGRADEIIQQVAKAYNGAFFERQRSMRAGKSF